MLFNELELVSYIQNLMKYHPDFQMINKHALVSEKIECYGDILAKQKIDGKWVKVLIEVKSSSTFTNDRLLNIINQINLFRKGITDDFNLIFAFPGLLPKKDIDLFLNFGITVWDRDFLAKMFKNEIQQIRNNRLSEIFVPSLPKLKTEESLITELRSIKPGKKEWSKYQKHVERILSYLFGDTLSAPITEVSDKDRVNRRDFILRNYCDSGFWNYLRVRYQADFITIDCKNYTGKVKKNQILQMANYLKPHGAGLFAIIISRTGLEDNGSYFTRKEKWITERKMIIILGDSDIEKMILAKETSNLPEEIIKQKIEDFRLEI